MQNDASKVDRWATFRPAVMPRSLYWHIPFCRHRCGYCNFTLAAGRDQWIDPFVAALKTEVGWLVGRPVLDTVYWGGGTPSHLGPNHLERLFRLLHEHFDLADDAEFVVEANPEDVSRELLETMASYGVNRISLGVQSFLPDKLRSLDRRHTVAQSRRAISLAHEVIGNVAVDLIFASPGESMDDWQRDLDALLEAGPHHVSTYDLTFEKGTAFWSRMLHGELTPQDDDPRIEMYRRGISVLADAGYQHYEISNFARSGFESRHNRVYWEGREYLAFGAGASRFVSGVRETNHRSVSTWLRRVTRGEDPVAERERLSPLAQAADRLAFGLRMLSGIDDVAAMRGIEATEVQAFKDQIQRFVELGWLERERNRIKLTQKGLLMYDTMAAGLIQVADGVVPPGDSETPEA